MVRVEHDGKKYALTTVGENPTWVDNRNIIVSVELQGQLRSKAISEGVDKSVFVVKKRASQTGNKPKVKRTRKKKESLGVKLF